MRRGAKALGLTLLVATALACDRTGANTDGSASHEGPCPELSARLCQVAGASSPTCFELASALRLLPDAACRAGLEDVDVSIQRLAARAERCAELATRLCSDLGAATTACQRVKADAPKLPSDRCEMMLAHYQATLASIEEQAAADAPLDAEQQRALAAGSPPGFGPEDAKVTLVQFVDFECPFCSKTAPVVAQLRAKYGDRVRFVVRQYPLAVHPHARTAAEAALAAHAQGRFWELHDRLYAGQASLDRASLERLAAEAGLDVGAFRKALDEGRFSAAVDSDLTLGEQISVDGTPTLFVNGIRVESPGDYDEVSRLIETALAG